MKGTIDMVDSDELIKLAERSRCMEKSALLGAIMGDAAYLGAVAPLAAGAGAGYLYDWSTAPDEDDYKNLREAEKIRLYNRLASHANMRAKRLMEEAKEREENSK